NWTREGKAMDVGPETSLPSGQTATAAGPGAPAAQTESAAPEGGTEARSAAASPRKLGPWAWLGALVAEKHTLALLDQAVVSGSSFLTTILIGRWCGAEELGIYS